MAFPIIAFAGKVECMAAATRPYNLYLYFNSNIFNSVARLSVWRWPAMGSGSGGKGQVAIRALVVVFSPKHQISSRQS